ncbi:MAG: methyltransferase domain-containing protein [Planctomycetes bacterium]|nr:methyltransferase domain-containing protein [Planctomycetota bacterium]
MSSAERRRWDARYGSDDPPPSRPSRLVTVLARLLPRRGRALDLAGGAGRHAIWLARRGLRVTVADVSSAGLALARRRARAAGVRIATTRRDLDRDPLPRGPWDLILVFHYLQRRVWKRLPGALRRGGVLVLVHPTRRNLERHAHPSARHLLGDGEMSSLFHSLEVLEFKEGWLAETRHEAVFVGRRPTLGPN